MTQRAPGFGDVIVCLHLMRGEISLMFGVSISFNAVTGDLLLFVKVNVFLELREIYL